MKTIVFSLLMLVASAAAVSPVSNSDLEERRGIADVILNLIELLKKGIQERGLDPFEISDREWEYVLIGPSVFSASASVENFKFSGLSNIVVNEMSYSVLSSKLRFNVVLPEIQITAADAIGAVSVIGREINAEVSGRYAVKGLGISGEATIRPLANSRVSVSGVTVSAKLRSIESALYVNILGIDVSTSFNTWNNNLPENLKIYEDVINSGLARLITIIVNRIF